MDQAFEDNLPYDRWNGHLPFQSFAPHSLLSCSLFHDSTAGLFNFALQVDKAKYAPTLLHSHIDKNKNTFAK